MRCGVELEGCPGEDFVFMHIGPLGRGRRGPAVPCCRHCYRILTAGTKPSPQPQKPVLVATTRKRVKKWTDTSDQLRRLV